MAMAVAITPDSTPQWISDASAEPRFALSEGLPCAACHVNPSGGGMRNNYGGSVFATTSLPTGYPWDGAVSDALDLSIGDVVSLGGDARLAYIDQRPDDGQELSSFFQMQADLYVAANLFDGLTLYYDRGARGSFEAIVLYEYDFGDPDWNGYIKAGQFMPTYGLRLANHNLFVRQDIGFGPNDKDLGLELGFGLGPFQLQAAVLAGAGPARTLDDNTDKAIVVRVEHFFGGDDLTFLIGGSFYDNRTGFENEVNGETLDTRVDHRRIGGHWGLSVGRFTYLGEADYVDIDSLDPAESDETGIALYNELDVLLVRGLHLILAYGGRDRDIDVESGTASRITAGLDFFPMPNLEIMALYRHTIADGDLESSNDGFKEVIAMLHAYF